MPQKQFILHRNSSELNFELETNYKVVFAYVDIFFEDICELVKFIFP